MIAVTWVGGLVRRRPVEFAAAVLAIALSIGFLAALGTFVSVDRAHLTTRAAASVVVDWQVQSTAAADVSQVSAAARRIAHERAAVAVDLAAVRSLSATSASATRTTGRAWVVGLPASYPSAFPAQMQALVGDLNGAVLLQQTASNLAVAPGSTVAVQPPSGPVRHVRITGVATMPQEDSFFQTVGAPAGAGPSAPPDNVLVVPSGQFSAVTSGATVIHQVHVGFDHTWLPADPARAAAVDAQARNHFEGTLAGAGLVGDNLGAALSAAREDALYGELLFLLLGLPAFVVALAVTALVVGVRGERRVRELALLRVRGARTRELAAVAG
ncbi:MAG TPA: ABC transporter permease, partial [Mycobacteriales bacterium]|nr:ABC transporter permease [Mycobacteriales bacterium]